MTVKELKQKVDQLVQAGEGDLEVAAKVDFEDSENSLYMKPKDLKIEEADYRSEAIKYYFGSGSKRGVVISMGNVHWL